MTGIPADSEEITHLLQFRPGKWSLVIITSLRGGVYRFSELRRRVGGINQKTLAVALRELERDGFVTRTAYATIPPKVEYELTRTGLELLAFAESWRDFILSHRDGIEAARRLYDRQNAAQSVG